MSNIKNMPKHEQPREKLIALGVANLRDRELLAIILRTGREGKNVLEVAEEILRKFSMSKLIGLSYQDLIKIKGVDSGKACSLLAAFELTKRAIGVEDRSLPQITNAKEAAAQLTEMRSAKREHFVVLYLNARNELIHKEVISIGTLNSNLVHPREVFKPALDKLAAAVVVSHNHPSGNAEPSEADIALTKRLQEAGRIMGIDIRDHIIISPNGWLSLRELMVF